MILETTIETCESMMIQGKKMYLVTLDKSYLEVSGFSKPHSYDNSVKPKRKRKKKRLPEVPMTKEFWLRKKKQEYQIEPSLAFVAPLTAPAELGIFSIARNEPEVGDKVIIKLKEGKA